jgi:hypothetical protein
VRAGSTARRKRWQGTVPTGGWRQARHLNKTQPTTWRETRAEPKSHLCAAQATHATSVHSTACEQACACACTATTTSGRTRGGGVAKVKRWLEAAQSRVKLA